jgi:hypothetical protein
MITDKPFCAYMMHALIETLPTLHIQAKVAGSLCVYA